MGSTDSELDSIFQDNKRHRNRLVPIGGSAATMW
uniref:Uncharacterized protein n=1 Tax=Solanum lycopersicum TaxID=4081 RepID=A0A3Q7J0I8_SOLLC